MLEYVDVELEELDMDNAQYNYDAAIMVPKNRGQQAMEGAAELPAYIDVTRIVYPIR